MQTGLADPEDVLIIEWTARLWPAQAGARRARNTRSSAAETPTGGTPRPARNHTRPGAAQPRPKQLQAHRPGPR
jgi:hypothetical protein